MPIQPYTGPFGRAELAHLLRRSLFGCTNADLAHFEGRPLDQVVDELLTFGTTTTPPIKTYWVRAGGAPDPTAIDPNVPFGSTWVNTPTDPGAMPNPQVQRIVSMLGWHTGMMVHQERNLREKLALFWFNHMPVEAVEVQEGILLYRYNQLLREHCGGNFRQLVQEVTLSGAMLIYLNGFLNTNQAPDENYARELMELFTLGEGTGYTEDDVRAAARVLTGWSIRFQNAGQPIVPETFFRSILHDSGNKQFSPFFSNRVVQGRTGASAGTAELSDLLDMIFQKEEVSRFVCRELYRFFSHTEVDAMVEQDVVEPLAEVFRTHAASPDQMRHVLRALLTSDRFFSEAVRGCMIKSPVDLVAGALRQYGMPFPDDTRFEAQNRMWQDVAGLFGYCGQDLLNPPNVAGWPAYYQLPQYDKMWMDTATFPARNLTLASILFNGLSTPNIMYQPQSRNLLMKADLVALVGGFTEPRDPNRLVADAAELLFTEPISQSVRDRLKTDYLLLGQASDHYWTDAYEAYVADPNTTDMTARLVPDMLLGLFLNMAGAAEIHQH